MPCHVAQAVLDPRRLVVEREGALRIRDLDAVESVLVFCLRRVEAVRRLVTEHHQPRLAAVIALQPVEGDVGDGRCVVVVPDLAPLAVDVELGAEILALALVGHEVVEPRPRRVVPFAHVVLADVRRRVPVVVELVGKVGEIARVLGEVVGDAVLVRVEAAQERRPARRAQRRRAERVPEVHALASDAIDVRRLDVGMSGVAERVPPEVVEQDEEDVRSPRRLFCRWFTATGGQERTEEDEGRGQHRRCLVTSLPPEPLPRSYRLPPVPKKRAHLRFYRQIVVLDWMHDLLVPRDECLERHGQAAPVDRENVAVLGHV